MSIIMEKEINVMFGLLNMNQMKKRECIDKECLKLGEKM